MTIRLPNPDFPFAPHYQLINGHSIHFLDEGAGDPLLMLHGNPSWTYGWRHIIPGLSKLGRVVAPDNIGMGKSDKPPELSYNFFEHLRYLEAFLDMQDLRRVTLFCHDWGAYLGIALLRRHTWRFKGVIMLEPFSFKLSMGPMGQGANSDPSRLSWHPAILKVCLRIIDPVLGPKAIFEEDAFNREGIHIQTRRTLSEAELEGYRAPYAEPQSRRAQYLWPGQAISPSPEILREAQLIQEHMTRQNDLPKLLLYASESMIGAPEAEWFRANMPNLTAVNIGEGYHYFCEDQPQAVVDAVAGWQAAQPSYR